MQFLSTPADIAIYGGAAGGGKTFALLMEPLRHMQNPGFGAVIFRRTSTQVRNEGGLWDESNTLYRPLGSKPHSTDLHHTFPSGMSVGFGNLEHEDSVYNYQGAQIGMIGFDELTHFTEKQFWYMVSRNRSTAGVRGYIRATCNPDPDSFVRKLIDWWIDSEGWAIPERSGVIRWFVRINEELRWADTAEELHALYDEPGEPCYPLSFTFILSRLSDNPKMTEKDPAYLSKLKALSRVERLQLLGVGNKGGNWNARASAGLMFRREWFPIVEAIPAGWVQTIRYWDRAATTPNEENKDPDWTRGVKMYRYPDGRFLVADMRSCRDTPFNVEWLIKTTAQHDGPETIVMSQQDPGSAGKFEGAHFVRTLAGFDARTETLTKKKEVRARPVSAQCEVHNVWVLRAPWNDEFFRELEAFPESPHDDIADALSGAFNALTVGHSILDVV